ncbi:MAG TPA: hypothetical protein VNR90_00425 [Vicinamibacterales bacterium]|nr:hypothetical protein [Vicinamibacterales bacterium]
MIAIDPADVVPMDQFPLAWRFTDERWDARRGGLRADLRPLRPARARELAPRMAEACAAHHQDEGKPDVHVAAPCESAVDVVRTRDALAGLPVAADERIVVSWEPTVALETSWRTFTMQWQAFCYPGTDDVTISPLGERWVLCYHHWEAFSFTARVDDPTA